MELSTVKLIAESLASSHREHVEVTLVQADGEISDPEATEESRAKALRRAIRELNSIWANVHTEASAFAKFDKSFSADEFVDACGIGQGGYELDGDGWLDGPLAEEYRGYWDREENN
jgi:hypothetical protein